MGLGNLAGKALEQVANHKVGTALGAYSALDSYQTSREEGKGVVSSMAVAGMDFALPYMLGGWGYAAYTAATELPGFAIEAYSALDSRRRQLARDTSGAAFASAHFNDSQMAYTMRQAGMNIAERSKYNINQAMLGNEAKYMKR